MKIIIYFSLAFIFFLVAFLLVQVRMWYLVRHPKSYIKEYDGHTRFLDVFFATLRFSLRKIAFYLKLLYQNLLHLWVKLIAYISSLSDKAYMKSRDKFMKEVVKDKKAVPHFWNHLKKYKREIDEENEEKEGE